MLHIQTGCKASETDTEIGVQQTTTQPDPSLLETTHLSHIGVSCILKLKINISGLAVAASVHSATVQV